MIHRPGSTSRELYMNFGSWHSRNRATELRSRQRRPLRVSCGCLSVRRLRAESYQVRSCQVPLLGWHSGHQNVVRASLPCLRDSMGVPQFRQGWLRRPYTHSRSSSLARPVVRRMPV